MKKLIVIMLAAVTMFACAKSTPATTTTETMATDAPAMTMSTEAPAVATDAPAPAAN